MDIVTVWILGVAALAVALIEVQVRREVVRRVERRMHESAGPRATQADGSAGPEAAVPAAEVEPKAVLEPVVHRVDDAGTATMAARQRWSEQAGRVNRQVLATDLGFAATYAALPLALGLGSPTAGATVGLLLAGTLAVGASLRHALGRRRYAVADLAARTATGWRRALGLLLAGILVIGAVLLTIAMLAARLSPGALRLVGWLPRLFTARVQFLMSGLFAVGGAAAGATVLHDLSGPGPAMPGSPTEVAAAVGLVLAALMHAAALVWLVRRLRRVPGPALLVLRVFGIEAHADFLFNHVTRYWSLFGHHFTVVDAAMLRRVGGHRLGWGWRIALVGTLAGLLSTAWAVPEPVTAVALSATVLAAVAAGAIAVARRRIDGRFLRDRAQLLARLRDLEAHPCQVDRSFRHVRVLCHADTWFMAVTEFARRSAVVVMDLRGWQTHNVGCQHEIDGLFDTVPVDRLVILVDTDTPLEEVWHMLVDRWTRQSPSSPNVDLAEASLHLYLATTRDARDLQALVDLLIAAADGTSTSTPAAVGAGDPGGAPPGGPGRAQPADAAGDAAPPTGARTAVAGPREAHG